MGSKVFPILSTRLGVFLVSIPIVLVAVQLVFLGVGEDGRGLVADVGSPLFSSFAAFFAFVLYWYNRRTPFKDIGLGFALVYSSMAIAETIYAFYVEVLGIEPRVCIADAFWIAGYLGLIVLFAKMVLDSKSKPSKQLMAMEVVFWALALPFIGYVTYQSFLPEDADVLNMITMAIYMWGDAVILSLLIALLASDVITELQEFRTFVSVSTVFIMGGDILYTVFESTVGYTVGSPPDVFFVSGYFLLTFGFALLVRARRKLASIGPDLRAHPRVKGWRHLKPMTTYLVLDGSPSTAYEMLVNEVKSGRKGVVVSDINPQLLRKEHGLGDIPILFVTTSPGRDVVHPANLGILTDTIVRMTEGQAETVILMEGFGSLLAYNDFGKVLRMVDHLKDTVSLNRASLIISLDGAALSDKERVYITKGAESIST